MKKILTIFLILFLSLPSFSYDEELLKFFPKEYLDKYLSENMQGTNDLIDNWNGSNIIEGPEFNAYYPPGTNFYPFRTQEEQAEADKHSAAFKSREEAYAWQDEFIKNRNKKPFLMKNSKGGSFAVVNP